MATKQATAYPFEDGFIVEFPSGHSVFVKDLKVLPDKTYTVAEKRGKSTAELIAEADTETTDEKDAE